MTENIYVKEMYVNSGPHPSKIFKYTFNWRDICI